MIQITERQSKLLEELRSRRLIRGIKMNTRIVYELWPALFGVAKKPNGCNACLRSDMNQFFTKIEQLEAQGEIHVVTDTK